MGVGGCLAANEFGVGIEERLASGSAGAEVDLDLLEGPEGRIEAKHVGFKNLVGLRVGGGGEKTGGLGDLVAGPLAEKDGGELFAGGVFVSIPKLDDLLAERFVVGTTGRIIGVRQGGEQELFGDFTAGAGAVKALVFFQQDFFRALVGGIISRGGIGRTVGGVGEEWVAKQGGQGRQGGHFQGHEAFHGRGVRLGIGWRVEQPQRADVGVGVAVFVVVAKVEFAAVLICLFGSGAGSRSRRLGKFAENGEGAGVDDGVRERRCGRFLASGLFGNLGEKQGDGIAARPTAGKALGEFGQGFLISSPVAGIEESDGGLIVEVTGELIDGGIHHGFARRNGAEERKGELVG